jgi:Zn-dependent protease
LIWYVLRHAWLLSEIVLSGETNKGILIPNLPEWLSVIGKSKYGQKRSTQAVAQVSSQFSSGEIGSIIVAWIVLSFGITYSNFVALFNGTGGSLDYVVAGFIATATGFIIHEMGHKFVAIRRGYVAHFRLWTWGLLLTIFTVVATGGSFLFGAPGAVYIAPAAAIGYGYGYSWTNRATDEQYENMIISAAGPGINLAFAVGFLGLILVAPTGFLLIVGEFGFLLNAGLGSFNMLPIPPLDGSKIFRKSIPVALAIALPLWGLFLAHVLGFI